MANVLHASLTGSDLHESKGAASAASGQVAIANGTGSAVFAQLQWGQVGGKPVVPSVYYNNVAATDTPLIKSYTATASSGAFSVTISGFSVIHNVIASCISAGTGIGTDAVAVVRTFTSTSVTGSVIVLGTAGNTLGTTEAVRITVIGV